MKIKLQNTNEIVKLVAICTKYNADIDAINGSIIVDAKSIVGVTNMGTEIDLRINTNNEEIKNTFYSEIKNEFIVKE